MYDLIIFIPQDLLLSMAWKAFFFFHILYLPRETIFTVDIEESSIQGLFSFVCILSINLYLIEGSPG